MLRLQVLRFGINQPATYLRRSRHLMIESGQSGHRFGPLVAAAMGHRPPAERPDEARRLLALVHLDGLEQRYPAELSGGQQQRAAIARTLVQGARVVLADEPIASLDPEASRKVMEILARINREDGCTVVVSLHQVDMAMRYCARVVALHQGRVRALGEGRGHKRMPVFQLARQRQQQQVTPPRFAN